MIKRIVIVGAGFAGIKLARELQGDYRFHVTLISDKPNFEYHAALYRSATGRSPLEVSVPLATIFHNTPVELVISAAAKIDAKTKQVVCADKTEHAYDELVLAAGSVTSYFGITGLPDFSYGTKTFDEAMRLKEHLHEELTNGHKPDLHYVVIGGGPAGVELAGELVSYLHQLRINHSIHKPFHVDLVEAAPRILPILPESFSKRIHERLTKLGVRIYTGVAVKGESVDALVLPNGSIKTHTVVWTAGMTNSPLFGAQGTLFTLGKGGKVEVDENLSAGNHIWVAGDSASTVRSGLATTAVYDGGYLACVLKAQVKQKPLPHYEPPKPVVAIPVGPDWAGIIKPKGNQYFGYSGWVMRRYLDWKLCRAIMPFGLALRTVSMGMKRDEECESCK